MPPPLTNVCAFTPLCDEDAAAWLPQYLAEAERVGVPFVMHFDRCAGATRRRVAAHPLCVGSTAQDDPAVEYHEKQKQAVLDLAHAAFPWALHWDADETWERGAREKLLALPSASAAAALDVRWVCLWGDDHHARTDGEFAPGRSAHARTKLYRREAGGRWEFLSGLVYGPTMVHMRRRQDVPPQPFDLACLHHGYKTRGLRLHHKARWDRIYGALRDDGQNPYGMWALLCDEVNNPPTVEPHGYS